MSADTIDRERVGQVRAHDILFAEEGDDGCRANLASQFAILAALPGGWLDGEGTAYDSSALDRLRKLVDAIVQSSGLSMPYVYPHPEGRVQAEWSGKNVEVSVSFSIDAREAEVTATTLDTRVLRDPVFDLSEPGAELQLAQFLGAELRGAR